MATTVLSRPVRAAHRSPMQEVGWFVALAFLGAWAVGGIAYVALDLGEAGLGIGVLMVTVAALALTRRDEGSMQPMLEQILRWRLESRWYAAALLLPLALVTVALLLAPLAGGAGLAPHAPGWATLLSLPLYVLLLGGPEELGWRGYALPRLQSRFSALPATLLLAGIWMTWHVPVFVFPTTVFENTPLVPYMVIGVASAVVYTWLYNSTRGSILIAMLLHGSGNLALSWMNASAVTWAVLATAWVAVAVVIVAIYGPVDLARLSRHQSGGTGHVLRRSS